jgi:Tfp pilus assembly PilM family ATPase
MEGDEMIWVPKVAAVEIGDRAVRVALVRTGPGRPRVLALAEREIVQRDNESRNAATVRALKSALEELKGTADVYVSHLPGRSALVRVISVPFARRRQIETTVKFELEPYVPLPIDELVVDFSPISVSDGKTEVLAVAVRERTLCDHLETLAEAGVDPEIVDLDFSPLTSLFLRENSVREKDITVLVHATGGRSQLVVLEGRKMVYLRGMDFSAHELQEGVQQTVEQILTTLRAFAATSRRTEVGRLVITGASLSEEQCTALEQRLGLSVSACELGRELVPSDESARGAVNSWVALIGSALNYRRAAHVGFNFRKEALRCRGAVAGVKKHAAFSGALVAALILAGAGHLRSQVHVKEAEKETIEARMEELYKNTFGLDPIARDKVLLDMERKDGPLEKGKEEYKIYRPYLAGTAPTLDLLKEVITLIPDSPGLVVKDLSINKEKVVVQGEVADPGGPELIRQKLDASELLGANIEDSSTGPDKTDFTISATRL